MSAPGGPRRGPTAAQVRRRRLAALAVLAIAIAAVAYLAIGGGYSEGGGTVRDPTAVIHLELHSRAVGHELGVNAIVPPHPGPRGRRSLLVYPHGRGGYEGTFNDAVLRGQPLLPRGRGPVIAFPAGGDHGYWHDRAGGGWESWVVDEVIPTLARRFGIDRDRIAIGGISMGGFGALDIALKNPGMFCAVGGHSPALWFEGGETAPGAFDDAADFEANDVVGAVRNDPDAFGETRVWIDYGDEDPFRVYDEGFVEAMEAGSADFTAHAWQGAHSGAYWDEHWPDYQRFYAKALADC